MRSARLSDDRRPGWSTERIVRSTVRADSLMNEDGGDHHRWWARTRMGLLAAALTGAALLAAACGSGVR